MDLIEFGRYIKSLREEKGLTITELAQESGVSRPYLSQIEGGTRSKFPSSDVLLKISKALGLNHDELMVKAGYIEEKFVDEIKFLEEYWTEVTFKENRYEQIVNKDGSITTKELSNAELVRRFFDIGHLLTDRINAYYFGRPLTKSDRKRILKMLELMFQDRLSDSNND